MGGVGFKELLVILLVIVLVFGARRLPELGESVGKAIKGFKRGLKTDDDIEVSPRTKQLPRNEARPQDEIVNAEDAEEVERKG